jgi:hypothetical protein
MNNDGRSKNLGVIYLASNYVTIKDVDKLLLLDKQVTLLSTNRTKQRQNNLALLFQATKRGCGSFSALRSASRENFRACPT